jgi:hypothetical protein
MSSTVIMILCLTPVVALGLLIAISMLEAALLDRGKEGIDDLPADPSPGDIVAVEQTL